MATVPRETGLLVLRRVGYDTYVRLRDEPLNDHVRMTYHNGTLEIVSPAFRHEGGAQQLGMIVRTVAAVFTIPCIGAGSTTLRRGGNGPNRGYGKEPDQSYYFANLEAIRDNETIDLDVDPPPDVWIEVENRSSSGGRLPLYAALGVPEVWRYRARRGKLWFGQLVNGRYEPIDQSLSLPMLTPSIALDLLGRRTAAGNETAWDNQVRAWLADVLKPEYENRA